MIMAISTASLSVIQMPMMDQGSELKMSQATVEQVGGTSTVISLSCAAVWNIFVLGSTRLCLHALHS